MLIGAADLYDAISNLLVGRQAPQTQAFRRLRSGDRFFLVADRNAFAISGQATVQPFAIDEETAEAFLAELQRAIAGRVESLELPIAPTTLGVSHEQEGPPYVLFPDGLAMLLKWNEDSLRRIWSLNSGWGGKTAFAQQLNAPQVEAPGFYQGVGFAQKQDFYR
jgi:hypothetical protein